jgi:hypothetical protein
MQLKQPRCTYQLRQISGPLDHHMQAWGAPLPCLQEESRTRMPVNWAKNSGCGSRNPAATQMHVSNHSQTETQTVRGQRRNRSREQRAAQTGRCEPRSEQPCRLRDKWHHWSRCSRPQPPRTRDPAVDTGMEGSQKPAGRYRALCLMDSGQTRQSAHLHPWSHARDPACAHG